MKDEIITENLSSKWGQQDKCPKCGCKLSYSGKDGRGKEIYACTNRGQYGGGACGYVERR